MPLRSGRPLGRRGADLLVQVPLFESLSRRHLKKIAEHADEVSFRENETIVEADQPGGTFFVIVEGEVKVLQNERVIARAVPGEFFGEISLLDGGPRTASVVGFSIGAVPDSARKATTESRRRLSFGLTQIGRCGASDAESSGGTAARPSA